MLLSIIMPIYNSESTLKRAIQSVINQKIDSVELLLINDGSKDGSQEIAEQFERDYDWIKLFNKTNGGLSSARNYGIEKSIGDFLAFLDSDDEFSNNILQEFQTQVESTNLDLFIFTVDRIIENKILNLPTTSGSFKNGAEVLKLLFTHSGLNFYTPNKIYRSELFKDIRFPIGKLFEDNYVTYETVLESKLTIVSKTVGYHYYMTENSIVNSTFKPKDLDLLYELERIHIDSKKSNLEIEDYTSMYMYQALVNTIGKMAGKNKNLDKESIQKLYDFEKKYSTEFSDNKLISKKYKIHWNLFKLSPKLYYRSLKLKELLKL